jgi:hypothetical protein
MKIVNMRGPTDPLVSQALIYDEDLDEGEPAEVEIRRTRFGWSATLIPARAPHEFRLEYIGGYGMTWCLSRKAIERKARRMLARERRAENIGTVPVEVIR